MNEIEAERAHLAAARAALRQMHQDVITTETPKSGAEDNDDYVVNLYYKWARQRRESALVDRPEIPLFFGRLDYEPGLVFEPEDGANQLADRIYVGRRHVHEPGGAPLVVDWRAPISEPFYQATRRDRRGVLRRRRYGFSEDAELTAYEDEPLTTEPSADQDADPGPAVAAEDPAGRISELVAAEVERPRAGPMRDIVATIQPEQDDLVRAPLDVTLCVQGAPGTGKTAVGLHRVAYLLYAERDRLEREGGIAIIGPNQAFLSYIRHVLPALGEVNVVQTTFTQLIGRTPTLQGADPADGVAGDARMAAVLRRAVWAHIDRPTDGLVYSKGSARYRVPEHELAEIVAGLRQAAGSTDEEGVAERGTGGYRYTPGRNALAQRIAHAVLVRMERRGESPDDRVQNQVARSKPVRAVLDAVWPKLTPERVLFRLRSDPEFLATVASDELSADEQRQLSWSRPYRSVKSTHWTEADIVLLDELADLIEPIRSVGHLVVDEAQDLSPMQLRALGRRCRTATVLGDLAQATNPAAARTWKQIADSLGVADPRLTELVRGFRVPAQIIEFAAGLLPTIAPELSRPTSVRTAEGALTVTRTDSTAHLLDAVLERCANARRHGGSVGVIAAEPRLGELAAGLREAGTTLAVLGETEDALEMAGVVCVPDTLAKGLEFDTVVLVEPTGIVSSGPRGLHRLYVALTRAVSRLDVVHTEPLPDPLDGSVG